VAIGKNLDDLAIAVYTEHGTTGFEYFKIEKKRPPKKIRSPRRAKNE
jgi:hypothetical protein